MGPRADEGLNERWISSLPFQCLPQCDPVKRDTKTGLIEAVRGGLAPIGGNWIWMFMDLLAPTLQTESTTFLAGHVLSK